MSLTLADKIAIVTGSSRGIGAAIAKRLARDGATVVVNYNGSEAAARGVVEEINAEGKGKAIAIKADMSLVEDAERLVEETVKLYGRLDIVINNAAILANATLGTVDEAQFDRLFYVNVKTPLFMVKRASRYMKHGGRIVFIGSSVTKISSVTPEYLIYTATKGAVEQLARVLAKDLGTQGVTVNVVAPGAVDTDMYQGDGKSAEFHEMVANTHPQKRLPLSDEIAPLVAFLASAEANWVNGQSIMVNGGAAV